MEGWKLYLKILGYGYIWFAGIMSLAITLVISLDTIGAATIFVTWLLGGIILWIINYEESRPKRIKRKKPKRKHGKK